MPLTFSSRECQREFIKIWRTPSFNLNLVILRLFLPLSERPPSFATSSTALLFPALESEGEVGSSSSSPSSSSPSVGEQYRRSRPCYPEYHEDGRQTTHDEK